MATIICPCVGDTYTNSQYPTGVWGGNTFYRYGRSVDIAVNIYEFNAYLQFDISALLRHKVTSINLVENRLQLDTYQSSGSVSAGVSFTMGAFKSLDENNIIVENLVSPQNSGQKTQSVGTYLNRTSYITSGVVRNDISGIFDPSHNQEGIYGLRLNYNAGTQVFSVCSSRESGNSPYLEAQVELIPGLAPTNLLPQTIQNPRGGIIFSWWHEPNPAWLAKDPQTGWQLEISQSGMTTKTITQYDANNQYTLPANSLVNYNNVTMRVRTQTQYNGWGAWAQSSFTLGATPPLQSTLIFPLNVSVSGTNGVPLEWSYNSPHDTFPTRFDVRYRLDGGVWVTKTNYSSGNNPAYQSIMTNPITTQNKVEWQVMAYGLLGDAGPWSETGTFWTIGVPPMPTIIRVSNSNRPAIYFSAEKLKSWAIEIRQNDKKIYETGNQPFTGEFSHVANQFFTNGNYIVRMRVTNEFGLASEWSQLPFTINTVAPNPLKLQIVANPNFNMRLYFDNTGKTVYIYRSEFRKDNYLRIGMTKENVFDDYTARPKLRYEYFCRVVNPDFSFADSNIETENLSFIHTTIAEYDRPDDMLKLWKQIDGKPTKDISHDFEKSLTQFVGRKWPVLQVGEHSNKSLSLSFYCSIAEYERLEQLHASEKVLILRDWRLGAVFGTIDGSISARRETDGCVVGFVFTQVDFDEEVELV